MEGAGTVELSLFLLTSLLFAPLLIMSFVLLFVCWFPVGRLLLLRDRESMSSCNLVKLDLVFLCCTGGEGCPSDLVLMFGGPITFDLRPGVSSLAQVLVLGFLWFLLVDRRSRGGGSWLIFSDMSFLDVAQLWCWGLRVYSLGVFRWGCVVTTGSAGYHFYSSRFREGVCFTWWRVFWWVLSSGVIFRVFIFGCSAYIRCLYFVFSISPVSVRLEQGPSG